MSKIPKYIEEAQALAKAIVYHSDGKLQERIILREVIKVCEIALSGEMVESNFDLEKILSAI